MQNIKIICNYEKSVLKLISVCKSIYVNSLWKINSMAA